MAVAYDKQTGESAGAVERPAVGQQPLRVLIVDDERANRLILSTMLTRDGHTVLTAANGQEAIRVFESEQPDMVLMDVMMPDMDGYETTRRIKAGTGARFVPVIFLTALHDDAALVECIAVGGDDFLTKPYKRPLLRAKMAALERIRQLHVTLQEHKEALARHHAHLQREHAAAEKLFTHIVHPGCLSSRHLQYILSPMAVFNGDVLLAASTPSGGLHVMVGDFTGHGLPAAVGAIPIADIFYSMTTKGYAIGDIVAEINQKLHAILPTGVFCAACLLAIDATYRQLTVWNGGLPDVLVYGAGSLRRCASQHFPLGIMSNDRLDRSVEMVELALYDRMYAYTDGVIEARNPDGEMCGQQRLESCVTQCQNSAAPFATLRGSLAAFCGGEQQGDDVTLIEITCDAVCAVDSGPHAASPLLTKAPTHWHVAFDFGADTLRTVDPLPQIIQSLMEFQGLYEHRERLYTVLAELFSNALEHGLLGLDSALKHNPQGFGAYYAQREERLATLTEGWINIAMWHVPLGTGGRLTMRIEDSGPGFEYGPRLLALTHNTTASGRGITLVQSLCQALVYHGRGNCAEAIYAWEK